MNMDSSRVEFSGNWKNRKIQRLNAKYAPIIGWVALKIV